MPPFREFDGEKLGKLLDCQLRRLGDIANFHNPALARRLRVEHEENPNTMGRDAGRAMAGKASPYHHLPFFYADLFYLGYEAIGELDPHQETLADC